MVLADRRPGRAVGRMYRNGVTYDVGTIYAGRISTRPVFDAAVTRREMEIIKNDLRCNAVRVRGQDLSRLMTAAEAALEHGLEVWLSPEMVNQTQAVTLAHLAKAATAAEVLRHRFPGRLIVSAGSESTLFVRGIVPGSTITKRVARLFRDVRAGTHHPEPLGDFLARADDPDCARA